YSKRHPGARDFHARGYVKLARPELDTLASGGEADDMGDAEAAPMQAQSGAMGGAVSANKPAAPPAARAEGRFAARNKKVGTGSSPATQPAIAVRKNFDALARFAPVVKTDARGRAQVAVKVPDNLTRYRIMVVAVSGGNQFGSGESSLTARMPLMVRPSPPRFLNFGDRFELPVVLQNQTSEAMSVRIAVQTTNAALTDGPGRLVSVPANDRVEVRFPAAAEMPGIARFQIGAAAGRWSDAAE